MWGRPVNSFLIAFKSFISSLVLNLFFDVSWQETSNVGCKYNIFIFNCKFN